MTHLKHLRPFLKETPFFAPMAALMPGDHWQRWQGYRSPSFFDSEQSEYFAIRHGASVYDISPLLKYAIGGRDAARFVDFLVTRDIAKTKPGQVVYTAWCQDDGKMIEEGTLFRLGENDFLLNAALPQLTWLADAAYGFDVAIEDISESLCGLSLQGPTARDILAVLGVPNIETLAYFAIREVRIDGHWLRIDRAGYTGDLGYEIWTRPESALWLWDRLFAIGEHSKIAPIGAQALDMARIEAGYLLVDIDYIGAPHAIRPSQRQSPIEAGIGWAVNLKKPGHFVGKRALAREKAAGLSRHILMGIEIAGRKPAPASFLYADRGAKREIGLTTSALWSPHLKKNIAFARVPLAYATPGQEIWVEIWYPKEQKIERSLQPCRIRSRLFFDPPRKRA